MTKNFEPTMLSSSHSSKARGAAGKARQSRESTRYSLAMSWAPGAMRPNGGLRSTSGLSPNRSR